MINDNTIIDLINMDGKIHILKIITKSFLKKKSRNSAVFN